METFAEYWTKHKYYVTQRTIASMQTCNANVFCNHTVENQKRQISLRKDSPTSTTLFQCLTIFRIVIWNKKLGWARKKVEESYWPSFCQFDNIVKWNRPKVEEEGIYLLPNSHTWSIFLQTLGVWEWQPAIWNPSHTLSFKGATFVKFAHWSTTTSRRGWVLFTEREREGKRDWIPICSCVNIPIVAGGDRVWRARVEFTADSLLHVGHELGRGDFHPALLAHQAENPLLLHATRLPARARPSLSAYNLCCSPDEKVQTVSSST